MQPYQEGMDGGLPARRHIVISGTGRCGTTFLVQLLAHLGLDTGFDPLDMHARGYDSNTRAGLESDIRNDNAPYVVKSPWFCDYAAEVLARKDILIEHVFIPIRDLNAAAESRRFATRTAAARLPLRKRLRHLYRPFTFHGGLWHTSSERTGEQEEALMHKLYGLLLALSDSEIPVTLMRYPRLVLDPEYLYRKLRPLLGDVSYGRFRESFAAIARPELVHSFNEKDRL